MQNKGYYGVQSFKVIKVGTNRKPVCSGTAELVVYIWKAASLQPPRLQERQSCNKKKPQYVVGNCDALQLKLPDVTPVVLHLNYESHTKFVPDLKHFYCWYHYVMLTFNPLTLNACSVVYQLYQIEIFSKIPISPQLSCSDLKVEILGVIHHLGFCWGGFDHCMAFTDPRIHVQNFSEIDQSIAEKRWFNDLTIGTSPWWISILAWPHGVRGYPPSWIWLEVDFQNPAAFRNA